MSDFHLNTFIQPTRISLSSRISTPSSQSSSAAAADVALSLKRPASPDIDERNSRKRKKGEMDGHNSRQPIQYATHAIDGGALADDLTQELQCGCCSALVYKPVIVMPCDHFFCGSCCMMWVKNGGTNCPACRSVSTAVMPSRALQTMVEVLLRAAPHLQRTERERMQADEIYPALRAFRIPAPREPSPEPVIPPISEFLQPCTHCVPNNPFHWACPQPVASPATDPDNAWRIDAGSPPGHAFCGNCEVLLALSAPSTSRCDFCQVSFCGINVQGRCVALPIAVQSPHGMTDVIDLIQSPEIYECFEGNSAEVEVMLDYIRTQNLTPRQIYRQITAHIQSEPNGFLPLIEQDLFTDIHTVAGGTDPDPSAPRRSICRLCATEVFLYGLRDWWIRERRKAIHDGLPEDKKHCPEGASCGSICDPAHAKEFNHHTAHGDEEKMPRASTSSMAPLPSGYSANRLTPPSAVSALFLPPISSDLFRSSSSSLPSISNLVSEVSVPRFYPPDDMFFGSDLNPRERSGENRTTGVQVSSGAENPSLDAFRAVAQRENIEAALEVGTNDVDWQEPSSSQSQRSVEAHLMKNLEDYDSDSGCEIETWGAEDTAGTMRSYDATAPGGTATRYPFSRHTSPYKRGPELDVSMEDVRAVPASSFVSFHALPNLGADPPETSAPHSSGAYAVQVE